MLALLHLFIGVELRNKELIYFIHSLIKQWKKEKEIKVNDRTGIPWLSYLLILFTSRIFDL